MNSSVFEVYKNKTVLITGHTGFKGAWLALWLKKLGTNVIGYALKPNTEPNLYTELKLEDQIISIYGDVRNEKNLKAVFDKYQPEIVFHLAAQPLVRLSYAEPKLTYETNIMGTINLFEAVRATKSVKVVLNVTSDKCYENREQQQGYAETDAMGGYDPYSSSKGCSELVTAAYRNSYFHPEDYNKTHGVLLASARAGNVIGGGDWSEDRLIPDCIKSLSQNKEIIIRSPYSIRPWQHVLEPLSGYLYLAGKMWLEGPVYAEGWNFGPVNDGILEVEKVVQKALQIYGAGSYKVISSGDLHEAKLLRLDITKSHEKLGWVPTYNIDQAIEKTVLWYKKFYEKETNMLDFSKSQIDEYIKVSSLKCIAV